LKTGRIISNCLVKLFGFFILLGLGHAFAQAPNISYSTPQTYSINKPITPLMAVNSGGAVPANIYGMVTTFAGGRAPVTYDSTGPDAGFNFPSGVAVSSTGNIYITDYGSDAIRKIIPGAVVTTIGNVSTPSGVAVDSQDNLFITSFQENKIYKIAPSGVKTVFAGNGNDSSVDGTGTLASFGAPGGITIDAANNLYIADQLSNKIRKITPAGIVITIAGSGSTGALNGVALASSFNNPDGVAIDASGNIYVADTKNNLIRKITSAGVVTTFAGSGNTGAADGSGTAASFNYPTGVSVDINNNVFVTDYNNALIRKITPAGMVTTLAGNGTKGSINAPGTAASFSGPLFNAIDAEGNMYVTDATNYLIRKIFLTGYTIDKPLPAGLTFNVTNGTISGTPTALSPAANYTVTAYNNKGSNSTVINIAVNSVVAPASPAPVINYQTPQTYVVNKAITPLLPTNTRGAVPATNYGEVSTFAGNGTAGALNGTGTAASFNQPAGLAFDASGNLLVADYGNALIRKITPAGEVTTYAGNAIKATVNGVGTAASFVKPNGVAFDLQDNIYVSDEGGQVIRRITPAGLVTTFAGSGAIGADNGLAATATFKNPAGVTADAAGNIYVADLNNNLIRKIAGGVVSTFAGSGISGSTDGTGTAAAFSGPFGLTADAVGNIYVADGGATVRKITPTGQVSTLASGGNPIGVTLDASGNIIVANYVINNVSKVSPAGVASALAGSGPPGSLNGLAAVARFNRPRGLAVKNGELFVADFDGNLIRKVLLTGYTIDKALPAGLTFDGKTGKITGTPTAVTPLTSYTITGYNAAGSSSTTLSIEVTNNLLPSVITFPLKDPDVDNNYAPGATSTNKETPIIYTSSNPDVAVVLPNGLIHLIAVGKTIITATQAGNAKYSAATPVFQTLTVTQKEVIKFDPLPVKYLGDADFNPGAVSNVAAFPVTYTSSNPAVATIVNGQIHIVGVGTSVITARQEGDDVYETAEPVSQTLTVNPPLVFGPLPDKTICDANFDPGASSSLPITYTSSNAAVATIVNGKVHIIGVGTTTITATSGSFDVPPQQLTILAVPPPIVSITSSIPNPLCSGVNVIFTATTTNAGTAPLYQWQVNGTSAGTNSATFASATLQDNDVITCTVTNTSTNCIPAPATISNTIQVSVNPPNVATVSIQYDQTPVCAGTPVTFTAQVTNEGTSPAYQWLVNGISTGVNTSTYTRALKSGDAVTCILTSSVPCSVPVTSAPVTVPVYKMPSISFGSTEVVINKGSSVQLRPVVNGDIAEYKWTPSIGLSNASAASPVASPLVTTTYQLQVRSVTGCYTYASITVNVLMPLVIYNTFTPNGDCINDTWNIPALQNYPDCLLSVSNRYGEVVYQSKGYSRPWDGTRNGQLLPVGTYYYIIDLKNNKPLVAGSVTIIR
jgi:gliding motility-associated-like protein